MSPHGLGREQVSGGAVQGGVIGQVQIQDGSGLRYKAPRRSEDSGGPQESQHSQYGAGNVPGALTVAAHPEVVPDVVSDAANDAAVHDPEGSPGVRRETLSRAFQSNLPATEREGQTECLGSDAKSRELLALGKFTST